MSLLISAIEDVLAAEQKPLELWRIAEALELSEQAVVSQLFSAMRTEGIMVTFRYPPLPCAAITAIHQRGEG